MRNCLCISVGGGTLHLDHFTTIKTYPFYIARISEQKNYIQFGTSYTSGVFVDVYPMDGLEGSNWFSCHRSSVLNRLLWSFPSWKDLVSPHSLFHEPLFAVTVLSLKVISRLFGRAFLLRTRYRIVDIIAQKYKFDESEYVGIPGWQTNVCWKRSYFDETVYLKFEDFEAPAPAGYDGLLRDYYGNYMQRPPKNEQKPHHLYTAYKR